MTEIKDFFKIYQDAAWNKDTKAMINLYHDQAVIFDMWDQGYCASTPEWNKNIKDWLSTLGEEKVKVEFEMININQSGTVGFATALIKYSALSGEGAVLRSMKNRITLGFSKTDDHWKVIHQHTSAPISSNGLKAIFNI
jgi:ketosteroid isomerase-like protein